MNNIVKVGPNLIKVFRRKPALIFLPTPITIDESFVKNITSEHRWVPWMNASFHVNKAIFIVFSKVSKLYKILTNCAINSKKFSAQSTLSADWQRKKSTYVFWIHFYFWPYNSRMLETQRRLKDKLR